MSIWDTFFAKTNAAPDFTSRLHKKVDSLFPNKSPEEILLATCIAGLMARVAYADMKIENSEKDSMKKALSHLSNLNKEEVDAITTLAIDEVKDLAGLENHLYCKPISENLSEMERFDIVKALFELAASDGGASNNEGEEIRYICTALLLEHKHFIAARAGVLDKLDSLKN